MTLSQSLIAVHPVFLSVQASVRYLLDDTVTGIALDDLVCRSGFPGRTVLLVVDEMLRNGEIFVDRGRIFARDRAVVQPVEQMESEHPDQLFDRYSRVLAANRQEPGLLWTQRWLNPESSWRRAKFIADADVTTGDPHIVFLGDDDATSPLAAALMPSAEVTVIDIDRATLSLTAEISNHLRVTVATTQHDLSDGPPSLSRDADVVVCDPFPSADGGFEGAFWSVAYECLRPGGILITTSHPSHKPVAYCMPTLRTLLDSGFAVVEARRRFGLYELFDFELFPVERQILTRTGLQLTASHTKSIIAAVRLKERMRGMQCDVRNVLRESAGRLSTHYLTIQAGAARQRNIEQSRGTGRNQSSSSDVVNVTTYEPEAILRGLEYPRSSMSTAEGLAGSFSDRLYDALSVLLSRSDEAILRQLEAGCDAIKEGPNLQYLALVIRALESWNRLT